MSNINVALIAEGPTDKVFIKAALNAILQDRHFTLSSLQPDESVAFGSIGTGWGGIYKWCKQHTSIPNPLLAPFDLIILHIDADVAGKEYADISINDEQNDLPCECPCPPAASSVDNLRTVVLRWLGVQTINDLPPNAKWVFCTPSKCTEAWFVAAVYGSRADLMPLINNIECNLSLEGWLSSRPITEGHRLITSGKKRPAVYREKGPQITESWEAVKSFCSQADRFHNEVLTIVPA